MTLRAKLLLWMTVLLAAGFAVSSFFVVRSTKANLLDQVDDRLFAARGALRGRPQPPPGGDPSGRQVAMIVYGPGGELIDAIPSGFATDPDPLPDVPASEALATPPGEVLTAPAVEGSLSYRAMVIRGPAGNVRVLAVSLEAVDETISTLVRNIAVIGAAMLVVLVAVGWLLLRRGLRPLEEIAATATSIAGGDFSRRADHEDERTEVGRLGAAFNTMLDRIETAFGQQRRALEERERSEARLRQFVADASHELRTPLATLSGYADLYRAGALAGSAELDRAMARIGAESARMTRLVEDLLLLARLDGGPRLDRAPVDLTAIVEDEVADLRALEPRRPVRADLEEALRVSGDEHRLRQVVGNLLRNVRVHTPAGAPVEIELRGNGEAVRLVVSDHGPGIAADAADRVFDRFYRADPARARSRGGSGLGLAIAKAIVHAHDGTIELSPTPGGGATFTISLPIERSEGDPAGWRTVGTTAGGRPARPS